MRILYDESLLESTFLESGHRFLLRLSITEGIFDSVKLRDYFKRGYTDAGVDYDSLEQNLQKWKTKGFKGITVQGSNGSYPYLSPSERIELVERLNDMLAEISNDQDDKMLLMAGAGAESTAETMKITEAMCLADADVLLVVTPSFYKNAMKPSVLVKHFRKIADFSDKPIIIYNVPANTGLGKISLMAIQNINHLLDMPAEAIADLADHPNICGVKDSGGDIAKIGHLLWLTEGKHFQVLAGSASFLHPALQLGASGGVCALANVSKYVSSYDFKFS
jgi:4-hydroxy-2-oxoglutarate aldolase